MDDLEMKDLEDQFQKLEAEGRMALVESGIPTDRIVFERAADMRYVGQEHAVTYRLSGDTVHASVNDVPLDALVHAVTAFGLGGLAGAVVIQEVLDVGGFSAIETTEEGLREGVFFESLLGDPPLFLGFLHGVPAIGDGLNRPGPRTCGRSSGRWCRCSFSHRFSTR